MVFLLFGFVVVLGCIIWVVECVGGIVMLFGMVIVVVFGMVVEVCFGSGIYVVILVVVVVCVGMVSVGCIGLVFGLWCIRMWWMGIFDSFIGVWWYVVG